MMMFWDSQYSLYWKSTALLSSSSMRERYFRMMNANSMNLSIIAEIARYGNNLGFYTNGKVYQVSDYYSQQAKMLNWFDKRLDVLKYQYTRNRWIFPLGAVNWSHSDNSILSYDSVITISINPLWKCYVTTNGEDPRLPGGVRNPNALYASIFISFIDSIIIS
jgi:hypothetical protein